MRAAIAQHFSLARLTSKQYTKRDQLRVLQVGGLVCVAGLELTLRRKCADAAKWCTKALEPLWGQDGRVRERRPAATAELSF